jgi:hypothetical protein
LYLYAVGKATGASKRRVLRITSSMYLKIKKISSIQRVLNDNIENQAFKILPAGFPVSNVSLLTDGKGKKNKLHVSGKKHSSGL